MGQRTYTYSRLWMCVRVFVQTQKEKKASVYKSRRAMRATMHFVEVLMGTLLQQLLIVRPYSPPFFPRFIF